MMSAVGLGMGAKGPEESKVCHLFLEFLPPQPLLFSKLAQAQSLPAPSLTFQQECRCGSLVATTTPPHTHAPK